MKRFHGILSMVLISIAIIIGIVTISFTSIVQAIIYIGMLFIAFGCVIYFYCGKCTCRSDSCGHVLPGKLSKVFPERTPGGYSPLDFFITYISMAFIVFYPQYWLWKYKLLFFIFWILIIISLVDIFMHVCKNCKNEHCPICPDFNR